jgi:Uma2 family endonuclease
MDSDVLLDEFVQDPEKLPNERPSQLTFEQMLPAGTSGSSRSSRSAKSSLGQSKAVDPTAPVTGRHQDLRLFVTVLLKTYVEMIDAGLVRDAPFQVQAANGQVVHPDIAFINHSNFDRVHETFIEGPPDIVVEISTPSTTSADRGDKFVLYESIGVREYWLVDPVRELVDFYHLGPDGLYDEFRPDIGGRLNSRVLKGFVLDIDNLWKRVLPTTVEIVDMAKAMLNNR